MRTSRKLTHYLMAIFAVAMMSMAALAADPGTLMTSTSEASDQKAGSMLVYTIYGSDATNIAAWDTKINITNTNDSNPIFVHFFFAGSCSIADFKTELTANQTYSFLTSDFDPGSNGHIFAIAENYLGVPIHFNYLIGDLYVRRTINASNTYNANLGAIAFSANFTGGFTRTSDVQTGERLVGTQEPGYTTTDVTSTISYDGSEYNRLPAVLAVSNIPSRAGNDRMLLTVFSPTGNLTTSSAGSGTLFGLLFDDAEQSQSFSFSFSCGAVTELSNTFPRTVPRFDSVIPAGRTGWMKFWVGATSGILGSSIVYNQQQGVNFAGGHNLHHLTLTSGTAQTITIPVFPFSGN